MTTHTLTLTDFLLARIAEEEEVAEAALLDRVASWSQQDWIEIDAPSLDHVRRHDPHRVLAECEVKRRIVEWHESRDDCCEERYGSLRLDASELSAGTDALGQLTIRQAIGTQPYVGCVTLMMLALPYADHPDYREEWRP